MSQNGPDLPQLETYQSTAESWWGPHYSRNRCHRRVFLFFHNRETMTVAIELRIAETDLWSQEAIESPGAAFDGAGQDRSFSIDRWWWREGPCTSGRTAARSAEHLKCEDECDPPIVVLHQPNPESRPPLRRAVGGRPNRVAALRRLYAMASAAGHER